MSGTPTSSPKQALRQAPRWNLLDERGLRTSAWVLAVFSLCTFLGAALADYLQRQPFDPENWLAAFCALVFGASLWLIKYQRTHWVMPLWIGLMVLSFMASSWLYGSIYTNVHFILILALVCAGHFLSLRAALASYVLIVAAFALMLFLQMQGLLRPAHIVNDHKLWLVYALFTLAIAADVYLARVQTEQAYALKKERVQHALQMEEMRDANTLHYQDLFQHLPYPALLQSPQSGIVLDANLALMHWLDYRPEKVLGRSDDFLWRGDERPHTTPHASAAAAANRGQLMRVRHSAGHFLQATVWREDNADGHDNLVLTIFKPVDESAHA